MSRNQRKRIICTEGNSACAFPNLEARTVHIHVKSGMITVCLENSETMRMCREEENFVHN